MIKISQFFGILVITTAFVSNAAVLRKDQILQLITSVHTATFSKDNLLTQKITIEDANKWYDLMKNIKEFVNQKDAKLISDYQILLDASTAVINTLKEVYNTQIARALVKPADKAEGKSSLSESTFNKALINLPRIKELIDPLKKTKDTLIQLQKKSKPGFFSSTATSDVLEVLKTAALFLEVTIDKVFADYKKLEKFLS